MRRIFRKVLKFLLPVLAGYVLGYVWATSVLNNGGLAATFSGEPASVTYAIFRLAGLTAFVLVSFQVIIGPFMQFFERLYGRGARTFHMYQGLFAFLFALLHPSLLLVYIWLSGQNYFEFSSYFAPFIYFGQVALLLMIVTVSTASLANLFKRPKFVRSWQKIHFLNYIIFFLAFVHSTGIGTDVSPPSSPLRPLWWIFFAATVIGLVYRRIYLPMKSPRISFSKPVDKIV